MTELCKKCKKAVVKKIIPFGIANLFDGELETYIVVWECPCGYSNENDGVQY